MKKYIPGLVLAIAIALVARITTDHLKVHILSQSVLALLLGMGLHPIIRGKTMLKPGLKLASKKVLKLAIILLGFSLSLSTILHVGRLSLTVMVFTLITCFGGGYLIGRLLKLDWKLSSLISAGTGICGGSAIAALAPVIEAKDEDIAYALSATFIFDMVMIIIFPIMGRWLGLDDIAFGLWSGTAVNDTSSVVATAYAFSEGAGDFATMVKLTRTLSIIPTVLAFSWIYKKTQPKLKTKQTRLGQVTSIFPWFIILFVVMALVNSTGLISPVLSGHLKNLSKFLMVTSLAAIGLSTDLHRLKKSGLRPMVHGFIISSLVVLVALTVITVIY